MVDPEVSNPADLISRKEKQEVLRNDRLARSTYFQHAQTDPDLELGGRFKKLTPSSVVGASPVVYPPQPEGSPWRCDPVLAEMPSKITNQQESLTNVRVRPLRHQRSKREAQQRRV